MALPDSYTTDQIQDGIAGCFKMFSHFAYDIAPLKDIREKLHKAGRKFVDIDFPPTMKSI